MTQHEIERVYEALAEGIDRAAPEAPELYLARVCLLLARELPSAEVALAAIAAAGMTSTAD
ncbi:hypothetical protein SDC9_45166 [bioreactor metagenome]|uniref:DUF2783 domain-containing protein n=1 Tax=bioreactor metagenome TaxID=1076179 RepID=A0A644W5A6_9ZZZZ